MNGFLANISKQFDEIISNEELKEQNLFLASLYVNSTGFSDKEKTEAAKEERIKRAEKDFFYFDKIYFPPEVHEDYSPPGTFHKEITDLTDLQDQKAHILIKPRDTASTSYYIKKIIYIILFGKRKQIAIGSETLDPAKFRMLDILYYLKNSPRIQNDFDINFLESSKEKIFIRTNKNAKGSFIDVLSIDRSSRGRSRFLSRYDFIFITDWENLTSSLKKESCEHRIKVINEMRGSLSRTGTLIAEGNNFDVDTAQNLLLEENDKGIINPDFIIHLYPAWDSKRNGRYKSIWFSRYPAKSESEMQSLMNMNDSYDWKGNGQGRPEIKSAHVFPKEFYNEYSLDNFPADLIGAIYADPNLSLKGKGDTTAQGGLFFSPSQRKFFILFPRCKSYSKSHDLLIDYLDIFGKCSSIADVKKTGFDGNVAQESAWTNNIDNFEIIEGVRFPPIIFYKLSVDNISTQCSDEWKRNSFYFPPGFSETDEGKIFLKQLFKFVSKKNSGKDDAPDWLICLYNILLTEQIADYLYSSRKRFNHIIVSKRNLTKIF